MTRGAAATVGAEDFAALAKGRTEGVAQVKLALEADDAAFEQCPVGSAA
jgi:hypothetical protein